MTNESNEAALREMSRSIGGLESTVKSLLATWERQEASAAQGRRDLHQKFESVTEKVTTLSAKVDVAISDITEIKPSVQAFENAKQQAKGAQTLGKIIWAMLGLGGVGIGWVLANWITITPKPPLH